MICNTRIRDSKVLLSSHLVVATSFLRSNTAIPKAALFLKSAFEKNKQHLIFFFLHENVPRETGFGRIYYDILHSCYILSLGQIIICVCVLSLLDHLKDSCYWAAIENSLCRAPCGAFFLLSVASIEACRPGLRPSHNGSHFLRLRYITGRRPMRRWAAGVGWGWDGLPGQGGIAQRVRHGERSKDAQ